jgi:hypothetical protein
VQKEVRNILQSPTEVTTARVVSTPRVQTEVSVEFMVMNLPEERSAARRGFQMQGAKASSSRWEKAKE